MNADLVCAVGFDEFDPWLRLRGNRDCKDSQQSSCYSASEKYFMWQQLMDHERHFQTG